MAALFPHRNDAPATQMAPAVASSQSVTASAEEEAVLRAQLACFAKFLGINTTHNNNNNGINTSASATASPFAALSHNNNNSINNTASSSAGGCSGDGFPTFGFDSAKFSSSVLPSAHHSNYGSFSGSAAVGGMGIGVSRAMAPLGSTTAPTLQQSTANLIADLNARALSSALSSSPSSSSAAPFPFAAAASSSSASSSACSSFIASLPLPLVRLVVDDVKLKLFRAFGEGADAYLMRHGALPPLLASAAPPSVSSALPPPSFASPASASAAGRKRQREEEAGPSSASSSLTSGAPLCLPATALDVSVRTDEMLSPNSMIAKMLSRQEDAKRRLNSSLRLSGASAASSSSVGEGAGGGSTSDVESGPDGGAEGLGFACDAVAEGSGRAAFGSAVASSIVAAPFNNGVVSATPPLAIIPNPKFPHHVFATGRLPREEVCRTVTMPLPEPRVVRGGSGGGIGGGSAASGVASNPNQPSSNPCRLVMPEPGTPGGLPLLLPFPHHHHSHHHQHHQPSAAAATPRLVRYPATEADRLIFLKEQEELLGAAINAAKQRSSEAERDVFLLKDKCERGAKAWRAEMAKEDAALRAGEMAILEARRKLEKARLELRRSEMEEERLSKIIRTTKK